MIEITGRLRQNTAWMSLGAALLLTACANDEPIPPPEPIIAQDASPSKDFLQACGMQLCLDGEEKRIHSATAYGQLDDPAKEIQLAKAAGLNTLEIVEYEQNYRDLKETMSEATWSRIDRFIAEAKRNDLQIILNLSSYGHSLKEAGQKPTTTDWHPFLEFVANRKNTETGTAYKDESTIAMVQLYGEIDAPAYDQPQRGTSEEVTEFYRRTLGQAQELFPNHLISTGGFSYINDPGSGIDWRTIMADPSNDVCSVEINSFDDRNVSVPNVSSHCRQLGKPWFLAAWSSCFRPEGKEFEKDANSWPSDEAMAAHAQDMYNIANNDRPTPPGPAIAAAGTSFWNLGDNGACDISPSYPKTFDVVRSNAP